MIEVPIFDQNGTKVESLQVDEAKLGGEVRRNLLKQALVAYHANKRQGTVQTLARGEVAGATRKVFRQKGTGNARTGGIRNPIKKGGGHAKQKRPKDWRLALPKKARRLARDSAILMKLQSNDVRVLIDLKLPEAKTKLMANVYKALGIDRTCLLALNGRDESIERSARNLDRTTLTTVAQLNAWDIMKNRTLLMTKAGLEQLLA
ncbi:MAG: 50S ribosomal protein L4 [Planctomycetota bacterium]|nr:50S ribosomal protein L4 [Planctomycetota bacterium]